jgi:imidazolonepropionase-like amidohydrolase
MFGMVWPGGASEPTAGCVIVDGSGVVVAIQRDPDGLPSDLPILGSPRHWVVPGAVDAHVHVGFDPGVNPSATRWEQAAAAQVGGLDTGLVAVRDLGAPIELALACRTGRRVPPPGAPAVSVSGPILTSPGGYPTRSWGSGGYAEFIAGPVQARTVVQRLAATGVDLIKVALEPGSVGWPVPDPATVRAVVDAAHALGLGVVAHALGGR